jgi:hypothetical protein
MPFTDFSKEDSNYVKLTVDLNDLLSPEKYKVIFYGEVRREGFLITDFTRLTAVPPLELDVSTCLILWYYGRESPKPSR